MKHAFLIGASLLFSFCVSSLFAAEIVAFPGAEGFGRFATGGRGGQVYYVTSLEDCSDNALVEGTLRWALKTGDVEAPRMVLFNVAGTIHLTSTLKCSTKNVSILGQSAPGGGVCIADYEFKLNGAQNVILRYLRFRKGDNNNASAFGCENSRNIIIDHCSFSWSSEENVTMYDNDSTTLQWTISSEALYNSVNPKGARSYGGQWGGEHSSFHHNIFAHCVKRVPQVYGVASDATSGHDFHVDQEMFNNVIYNAVKTGENAYNGRLHAPNVADAYLHVYMANNCYVAGPYSGSGSKAYIMCIYNENSGNDACTALSKWYINGNKYVQNTYGLAGLSADKLSALENDNWLNAATSSYRMIEFKNKLIASNTTIGGTGQVSDYKLDAPLLSSGIHISSADQAYQDVTTYAGCQIPLLDEVDVRVLAEAAGTLAPSYGTNGIINSQNDLKPTGAADTWSAWPDLASMGNATPKTDTDADGIPDTYEEANGEQDGSAIDPSTGYSYLELYLNSLTTSNFPSSVNDVRASRFQFSSDIFDLWGNKLHAEPVGVPFVQGGVTRIRKY